MKRWLLLSAGLVFILAGLAQVVSAQSERGYDWCYEFTFDFNDEGFFYDGDDYYAPAFGALASTDDVFAAFYIAPGVVNAKLIEVTITPPLVVAPGELGLTVNAFSAHRSGTITTLANSTENIVLGINPQAGEAGNTFEIAWEEVQNSGYSLTNIRVFGDGVSPWGVNRCYELPFLGWCWELDPYELAMPNGSVDLNRVINSDENNAISFSYTHPLTVNAKTITFEGRTDLASIELIGNVFGVGINDIAYPPAGLRVWSYTRENVSAAGTTMNVTLRSSSFFSISKIRFTGTMLSPFGGSNCGGTSFVFDPAPTSSPTAIPTSLPTSTWTPTHTATATPTPTPTGATPTPTPTPTAFLFFGPTQVVEYDDPVYSGGSTWNARTIFGYDPDNARIVGWWWRVDAEQTTYGTNFGVNPWSGPLNSSGNYSIPANVTPAAIAAHGNNSTGWTNNFDSPLGAWAPSWNSVSANPQPTVIDGWLESELGGSVYQQQNVALASTPMAGQAAYSGVELLGQNSLTIMRGEVVGAPLLYGWPTPSPTPTNTPQATNTRTPTRTPGPTFTPNGSATATRTPTRTPFQVQPPVNTIAPLPTIYNWLTPSGTYQVFGTPYGTPGVYGSPTPAVTSTGTPVQSSTPYTGTPSPAAPGTGTPAAPVPPEFGDVGELGGNVLGVGNNIFELGRRWLEEFGARVTGIVGAWNTAPVTAPPGVPLCTTQPQLNEFCAILYFLRFTIFSGPIGSLIMPLATIVFDLFIVFLFIRMLRAILARLSKVTEV